MAFTTSSARHIVSMMRARLDSFDMDRVEARALLGDEAAVFRARMDDGSGDGARRPGSEAVIPNPIAVPTNLSAGQLAIIGYNTDDIFGNVDSLTFVLLAPIGSGTQIFFTDRSWNGTVLGAAGGGDGTFAYTAGADLAAGTVITVTYTQLNGGGINLSDAGETVYAYQGAIDAPTAFLYAIDLADGNSVFNGSLTNTGLSVAGGTATAISGDNAVFATRLHNINTGDLLAQITNQGDWQSSDLRLQPNPHAGPSVVAPDRQIWVMGSGDGEALVVINTDESYNSANVQHRIIHFLQDNPNLNHPSDITFDTVEDKFFFVDADLAGHNRIYQGSISQMLSNPATATFITLYSNTSSGATNSMRTLSVDTVNNKIYFDLEQAFVRINYDTAAQTPTVLRDLEPVFGAASYITQMTINYANGTVFLGSSSVSSVFTSDFVDSNRVFIATGLTGSNGANSMTFTEINWGANGDTSVGGEGAPLGNNHWPVERGTIRGVDVDPVSGILYIVTGSVILDNDGNGNTMYFGGVWTYNPASGAVANLYTQNGSTGPLGLLYYIEVDPTTSQYYIVDETGGVGTGGGAVWVGSTTSPGTPTFLAQVDTSGGLGPHGLEIQTAPTLTGSSLNATYTETAGNPSPNGTPVVAANNFQSTDVDSGAHPTLQLAGAQVRISANYQTGAGHSDVLTINGNTSGTVGAISFSYNSMTGTMTLTGQTTLDNYEAALALVALRTDGDNPTNYGSVATRTLSYSMFDGLLYSDEVHATVTVVGVNDAPVNTAANDSGNEDTTVFIDTLSITDVDANPASQNMTVTLSVDRGTLTVSGVVPGGLVAGDIANNGTATVTLTGTQTEINTTLSNALGLGLSIGAHGNGTVILTMTTNDNGFNGTVGALMDTDQVTITVTAVNDAPTVVNGTTQALTAIFEDQPLAAGQSINSLLQSHYSDALDDQSAFPGGSSAGDFQGIAVVSSGSSASGEWQYSTNGGGSWQNIGAASTAAAKLFNDATLIRFNPANNFNGPAPALTVHLIDNNGPAIVDGVSTANLTGATGGITRYSTDTVTLSQQVNPVNDPPTSTNLQGDAQTWAEGSAAVLLDPTSNATIADVDSANFDTGTLTVTIVTGAVPAEEGLFVQNQGVAAGQIGVSGNAVTFGGTQFATFVGGGFAGGNIIFTFDVDATPAAVQALIRAMQYNNNGGDNPTAGLRNISWILVDGDGDANNGEDTLSMSSTVNVTVSNDPPVLNNLGGDSVTFTEGGAALLLDATVAATVTDPDNAHFNGGTLSASMVAGLPEDTLSVVTDATIQIVAGTTVQYDADGAGAGAAVTIGTIAGNGTSSLTVTFTTTNATPAAVTALVQRLAYTNTNANDPNPTMRTVSVSVNDGAGGSDSETVTVNVVPVNDEPTLTATGNNPTFLEGSAAVDIFSAVTASAIEAGQVLTSMTLTVTNVTDGAGEILFFNGSDVALTNGNVVVTATNGLTVNVTVASNTATVTFAGATLSAAQLQTLVDSMTYRNVAADPTNADRVVTITQLVDDGSNAPPNDNSATLAIISTVNVDVLNASPVLDLNGAGTGGLDNSAAYTENAGPTVLSPTDLVVSDADDTNIESATIQVTTGFQANLDLLTVNGGTVGNIGAIAFLYNAMTGILTLTGSDTLANYQAVLRQVGFESTSDDPGTSRTISWRVNDGDSNSNAALTVITITPINDEPNLAATGTNPTFTEDNPAVDLFNGVTVTTPEAGQTLTGMTLTVTNVTDGAFEKLIYDGSSVTLTNGFSVVTANNSVTVNVTVAANVATVTFTKVAGITPAQLQTLVDNLAYINDSQNPTDANRVITITQLVDSGSNASPNDNVTNLSVVSTVNVNPTNDAAVITGDSTGDVTEAGGVNNGTPGVPTDTGDLNATDADGPNDSWVAAASGSATTNGYGSYSLSAAGIWVYTLNDNNAAVQALNGAATLTDTFTAVTTDGASQLVTITIHAQDDAADAKNDAFLTDEATAISGNVLIDNGSGADSDPDNPGGITVTHVNGVSGNVGLQFALASGALLRVNANGTFTYDPNGAFDPTPTALSGASNTPEHDSFTYTITGGDTATVNITLSGLDTNDYLEGTAGIDIMNGGGGNDVVDGLGGADTLAGGGGNDFVFVDSADDIVVDAVGDGFDNVVARVSYTLNAGAYVEVLSTDNNDGTAAINLIGNGFANILVGNNAGNYLDGGIGGIDRLAGRGGDDFLIVDTGDVVEELAGGGYDNVAARSDYVLTFGAHVEVLSTTDNDGLVAINLIGNELANILVGNAASNYLDGGIGGIDRLAGRGGDDALIVDTGDVVEELAGGGYDNVAARSHYVLTFGAHVEVLSTTDNGGTTAINLTGNEFANILVGNAGDNILDGSFGHDRLDGLGGEDSYAFTTFLSSFNVDVIVDFDGGDGGDAILIDNAVFTGLALGALDPGAFVIGAAAADADDRIVYNSATGALYFDADGNGAGVQIQFATLEGAPVLNSGDFTVI